VNAYLVIGTYSFDARPNLATRISKRKRIKDLSILSSANMNCPARVQSVEINRATAPWKASLGMDQSTFFFTEHTNIVNVQVRIVVKTFAIY
jgi:hypothetical protein